MDGRDRDSQETICSKDLWGPVFEMGVGMRGLHIAGHHHHEADTFISRRRSPRTQRQHLSNSWWCLEQSKDYFVCREEAGPKM
jgi:hypothetical protein